MTTQSNLSALIEAKLAALAATQASVTTGYEYEKNFDEWWTALGREVFQASLGPLPSDRHQKKRSSPNSV